MKKKYSLKKLLLILLLSFIVLIPIAVGFLSTINLYNAKVNSLVHNQKQVLQQVRFEANKFLDEIDSIAKYMKKYYDRDNSLLQNIVDINNNITSIIILNKKGIISDFYAQENLNIYKGFDYSNKLYYNKIKEGSEYFWSDLFLSTIDETQSLSYSFKLGDDVGVIFIKLTDLASFIKRFKNADKSHMIRIYDNDGILILNPDNPYLQAQRVNAISESIFIDLINKTEPLNQATFKSLTSNTIDYGMYVTVNKTGWNIVTRENYDVIVDDLKNMMIEISVIVILFIAISLFFILRVLKRVFRSLDDLEYTTASIASGKYNTKIEDSYFNEFNELINSFKNMQHEIKKREVSLQKSVKSFESLVDSTMEAIILHDNGICFDVNEISVKLLGYKNKEEMIDKSILDFIAVESKEAVKSKLHLNYEPYEIRMLKADGSEFTALIQGNFIELNEKIVKITAIIDISEIKEKDKLLFQQSKMASMGEMIGNIAHQWRQPLSTISTAASGMKFQKEFGHLKDEDFEMSADAILNSTKYLSRTIDDFRNFFKSDKMMKEFSINGVIEKSLILMESSLKNNFIKVQKDIQEEVEVYGYENELMQALMNIINNTKDAFLIQGLDIDEKVLLISLEKRNSHAVITIKDNAGGIDEEVMQKVFEPYFTTKHKSQGTGIGLYMSHQIICDHMKGTLNVNNERFKYNDMFYTGAVFTIKLKLDKDDKGNNYII